MAKKKLPLPTKEELERRLRECLPDFPGLTCYEWADEDGTNRRSWKIKVEDMVLNTNDGGLIMFMEAVKKLANDPNRSDQI